MEADVPPTLPEAISANAHPTTSTASSSSSSSKQDDCDPWGNLQSHAGWVQKKPVSHALSGSKKDRFLFLDGLALSYYVDHTRTELKGVLGINYLSTVEVVQRPKHKKPSFDFVFREYGKSSAKHLRALRATTFSQFELDLWIQRITDAIEYSKALVAAQSSKGRQALFDRSFVADCEAPDIHWHGRCCVNLRGNLLWFSPSNDSRNNRTKSVIQREAAGSTPTMAPNLSTAYYCRSLSQATVAKVDPDEHRSITISNSYLSTSCKTGVSAALERPVRITFLAPTTKHRFMLDLEKLGTCIQGGVQGPKDPDVYVLKMPS